MPWLAKSAWSTSPANGPESRCRQNERVGPLDVGEVFPSGHDVPPIHVGCTCTTVPLLSGRSSDAEPGA